MRSNESLNHILQRSLEYENTKKSSNKVTRKEVGNQNIEWKPPFNNMLKLNINGLENRITQLVVVESLETKWVFGLVASPNIWNIAVLLWQNFGGFLKVSSLLSS